MQWPGFVGPDGRHMNWMPGRVQLLGKLRDALLPTPGLRTFASAPESPGRGIYAEPQSGRCFAVIGLTFYELFADGTKTSRGTVAFDGNPATITTSGDGGAQLFVTSGNKGYNYDLTTNVLTEEVDDVTVGGMLDGFFLGLDTATSTLRISDEFDGETWSVTQQAQRASQPDPWKGMVVNGPIILLFGRETTDPWFNDGSTPFPFVPVQGATIPFGIAATFSAQKVGSSVLWLSRTSSGIGPVVEAQGYQPRRVSNDKVDAAIRTYPRIDNAVAWAYSEQGHDYYVLNFPGITAWAYDKTTGMWHERGSFDTDLGTFGAWGPQYHAFAFDKHLVLHAASGTVYEMSTAFYTDADDAPMRRERIPPALFNENKRVFVRSFEVFHEPGLGLTTGQGSDPQFALSWSRDGGKTWGNERWRSAGELGEYGKRARWVRGPSGRNLLPKLTVSDPINWPILDAFVDVA